MIRNKALGLCGVVLFLTGMDQWTKWAVRCWLLLGQPYQVTCFFDLVSWWNAGISWGLFHGDFAWKKGLLLTFTFGLICFFTGLYWKTHARAQRLAFALIIAGALGNFIDRLFFGAVFDFLLLHWKGWTFPAFNLADILISMGFLIILRDQYQWNYLKKSKN